LRIKYNFSRFVLQIHLKFFCRLPLSHNFAFVLKMCLWQGSNEWFMVKMLYIFFGTLSLILGVTGIFVPGLPTTPFLLLTAALYIRSSDKLYRKLVSNRVLGPYILNYRKNKGMTKRQKAFAIALMWLMISVSVVFFIASPSIRYLLAGVGLIGTGVMGFVVPSAKR